MGKVRPYNSNSLFKHFGLFQDILIMRSFEGEYITGVSGKATTYARGVVTNGKTGTKSTISIAPDDYWEIRYDYDTAKGSHVNVKVGGKGEHKFAVMFPPDDHKRGFETAPGYYFDAIIDQSSTVGFYKGMDDASLAYCAEELVKVYHLKTKDSCLDLQCGGAL